MSSGFINENAFLANVPLEGRSRHTAGYQEIYFGSHGILQFMEQTEIVSGILRGWHFGELHQQIYVTSRRSFSPRHGPKNAETPHWMTAARSRQDLSELCEWHPEHVMAEAQWQKGEISRHSSIRRVAVTVFTAKAPVFVRRS
jgi:hypothetical protein